MGIFRRDFGKFHQNAMVLNIFRGTIAGCFIGSEGIIKYNAYFFYFLAVENKIFSAISKATFLREKPERKFQIQFPCH